MSQSLIALRISVCRLSYHSRLFVLFSSNSFLALGKSTNSTFALSDQASLWICHKSPTETQPRMQKSGVRQILPRSKCSSLSVSVSSERVPCGINNGWRGEQQIERLCRQYNFCHNKTNEWIEAEPQKQQNGVRQSLPKSKYSSFHCWADKQC